MKLKSLPAIRIEHMTEAEKRAYIIADNRIAHDSGFDMEVMAKEYKFLLDQTEDLIDGIGLETFDMTRIESILNFEETDKHRQEVAEGLAKKAEDEIQDEESLEDLDVDIEDEDDGDDGIGIGNGMRVDETEDLPANMPDMEAAGLERPFKLLSLYVHDEESYEKLKEFMEGHGGFEYLNENTILYPSRETKGESQSID